MEKGKLNLVIEALMFILTPADVKALLTTHGVAKIFGRGRKIFDIIPSG